MHSRSTSHICIDITGDDDENIYSNSEAELLAKYRRDVSELRAQVHVLQEENSALKSKLDCTEIYLNATRAELGKAVVDNKMQVNYSTTKADMGRSASLKRPRSPSLELVHITRYMGKGKVKDEIVDTPVRLKKVKIENTLSPEMRTSSPTKPIITEAGLKRPGADRRSTSSDISSQPDLNPRFSAPKVTCPSQIVSTSPLMATRRKARFASVGQEKLVMRGGHNSDLLRKSLKRYLDSAPTLPMYPRPLKARVKRVPFSKYYGGCNQHFLQYIPPGQNPSDDIKRRLVFPQPLPNPVLPTGLGEPGLIFASRHEVADGSPWSLFVKHDPNVAIWTYLGEYKGEVCGELRPDQFKTLSKTQQDSWFNLLLTQKSGVYFTMRIRIALRTKGLIPLADKEAEEKLIEEWKSRETDFGVTHEDVRTALYEGHEVIDLILMSCISYDHVFANDIRRNFTDSGTRRLTGLENVATGDCSDVGSDASDDIYVPE